MGSNIIKDSNIKRYCAGLFDSNKSLRFEFESRNNLEYPRIRVLISMNYNNSERILGFIDELTYELNCKYNKSSRNNRSSITLERYDDIINFLSWIENEVISEINKIKYVKNYYDDIYGMESTYNKSKVAKHYLTIDKILDDFNKKPPNHSEFEKLVDKEDDISPYIIEPKEPKNNISDCYMAGVFDRIGNLDTKIEESKNSLNGYSIIPRIRITRSGISDIFWKKIKNWFSEKNIKYSFFTVNNSTKVISIDKKEMILKFLSNIYSYTIKYPDKIDFYANNVVNINYKKLNRTEFINNLENIFSVLENENRKKYNAQYFRDKWDIR